MTLREAKRLKAGDRVWWHDPDEGLCDQFLTVKTCKVKGEHLYIVDVNGDVLECFPRELSLVTGPLVDDELCNQYLKTKWGL